MDLASILKATIMGIIEGITEFLPISSTGHLLIAEHWLGQRSDTFNVVIQAGAILAVGLLLEAPLEPGRRLVRGRGHLDRRTVDWSGQAHTTLSHIADVAGCCT